MRRRRRSPRSRMPVARSSFAPAARTGSERGGRPAGLTSGGACRRRVRLLGRDGYQMASAAEQLAASINFSAFAKASELKSRIWFTLGALVIYRLGTYIPIPGIDPAILQDLFSRNAGGILGMFDMFSGGALGRMTIFALNIMPYISASIIIQLLTAVSPTLEALKKEGESGRKKLNQYTRFGTVLLAAVQAYGIAVGLEGMRADAQSAVIDPGLFFRLVHGGDPDQRHRVPDVARRADHRARHRQRHLADHHGRHRRATCRTPWRRPSNSAAPARSRPSSSSSSWRCRSASSRFIVFMERAQRRILVQYPKRQVGNKHVRRRGLASAAEDSTPRASFRRSSPPRCCCCRRRSRISRRTGRALAGSVRSRPIWRMARRSTWRSMSA